MVNPSIQSKSFKSYIENNLQELSLKSQLNKALVLISKQNLMINELKKKLNDYNNIIYNYKNKFNQKNLELNNLKIQLRKYMDKTKIYPNEMMCVNFISTDQKIHLAIPCVKKNTFAEVEEKLYQKFPEYRKTNNNFIANGTKVLRFLSIEENNIGNGLPVTLIVPS